MALAWTYSDWITYAEGTTTRLQRLRKHIQEVNDSIISGDYAVRGRTIGIDALKAQLEELYKRERIEAEQTGIATGTRLGFTAARAILDNSSPNDIGTSEGF